MLILVATKIVAIFKVYDSDRLKAACKVNMYSVHCPSELCMDCLASYC